MPLRAGTQIGGFGHGRHAILDEDERESAGVRHGADQVAGTGAEQVRGDLWIGVVHVDAAALDGEVGIAGHIL